MAGSSFGTLFRISTAGESHGAGNIVIVDGCPAGLPLNVDDLIPDLERRKPGQSRITTPRKEADAPEILSGVFDGKTTGTPIAVLVRNTNQRSQDYDQQALKHRPGHADATFDAKFGFRDHRGGGRASARETVARVAAGAIARKLLKELHDTEVIGFVHQVGDVVAEVDTNTVTLEQVEAHPTRCPHPEAAAQMEDLIKTVRKQQDSIGGAATVVARHVPEGLGEPVFDKLRADLGKALFSLPAVLGVEFGQGFGVTTARGSEHCDPLTALHPIRTDGNHHGGMLGGISTSMPLVMRAAVKPTSSIPQERPTVDQHGNPTRLATHGRHDPCLLPRFVPMAEAMVLLTLADHVLRHRASRL